MRKATFQKYVTNHTGMLHKCPVLTLENTSEKQDRVTGTVAVSAPGLSYLVALEPQELPYPQEICRV